jgi:hypothetical protein
VEGVEFKVIKGAQEKLFKAKDIRILIEIYGYPGAYELKEDEFAKLYSFKPEFEKNTWKTDSCTSH